MPWKYVDGKVEASGALADWLRDLQRYYEEDQTKLAGISFEDYVVGFAKTAQELSIERWSNGGMLDRRKARKLSEHSATTTETTISYPVMPVMDFLAGNYSRMSPEGQKLMRDARAGVIAALQGA